MRVCMCICRTPASSDLDSSSGESDSSVTDATSYSDLVESSSGSEGGGNGKDIAEDRIEGPVAEKVINDRVVNEGFANEGFANEGFANGGPRTEYLVKWRDMSHAHNSWVTHSDLAGGRGHALRNYLAKKEEVEWSWTGLVAMYLFFVFFVCISLILSTH